MALSEFGLLVRAYYRDGAAVPSSDFVDILRPAKEDRILEIVADRGLWQSSKVVFSRRTMDDFAKEQDAAQSFALAIQEDMTYLGDWLLARESAWTVIAEGRLQVDVLLDCWIDEDQLNLTLPPKLLLACGKVGIGLEVVTND